MKYRITPILAHSAHTLVGKLLFQATEYKKENVKEPAYIFAPNHTNNFDGYLIWSLLSKDFDLDTFMYKEFWLNYPNIAKLLPPFHVYPITRNKIVLEELKAELEKLKQKNHSLIIFPQGRHVDPELMINFQEYHQKTIPLGAFYFSSLSNKPVLPIFMEPQQFFHNNMVVYGKALFPEEFKVLDKNGKINKKNMISFANAWVSEINAAYMFAKKNTNREIHPYKIEKAYTDASGENYRGFIDPNIIMKYKDVLSLTNVGFSLDQLERVGLITSENKEEIVNIESIYQKNLVRR